MKKILSSNYWQYIFIIVILLLPTKILFAQTLNSPSFVFGGVKMTDAIVKVPYNFSFCNPTPGSEQLCEKSFNKNSVAINPRGGVPPYTISWFPAPSGLKMNLNGTVDGTPKKDGTFNFTVCASDSSGKKKCQSGSLTVRKKGSKMNVFTAGSGNGTVSYNPKPLVKICTDKEQCDHNYVALYIPGTKVTITAQADKNSEFAGWSGTCNGKGSCIIDQNEDSKITATFTKKGEKTVELIPVTTIASSSCAVTVDGGNKSFPRYAPKGYYYFKYYGVTSSGTMAGPVGTSFMLRFSPTIASLIDPEQFTCGSWEKSPYTHNCKRLASSSETETWTYYANGVAGEYISKLVQVTIKATAGLNYSQLYEDPNYMKKMTLQCPMAAY